MSSWQLADHRSVSLSGSQELNHQGFGYHRHRELSLRGGLAFAASSLLSDEETLRAKKHSEFEESICLDFLFVALGSSAVSSAVVDPKPASHILP